MTKLWEQFGMKPETFERWAEHLYHQSNLFDGIRHSDFSATISSGVLPPGQLKLRAAFDELLFHPQADPTGILTRSVRIFSESPPTIQPQQSIPTDVDRLVAELQIPKDIITTAKIPFNVVRRNIRIPMSGGIGPNEWNELVKIVKQYPDTNLFLWPTNDPPLRIQGTMPEHITLPANAPIDIGTRGKREIELLSHIANYIETNNSTAIPTDLSWAQKTTYRNFDLTSTDDIDGLIKMVIRETEGQGLRSISGFVDLESRTLIIATTPYAFHKQVYDSFSSRPPTFGGGVDGA